MTNPPLPGESKVSLPPGGGQAARFMRRALALAARGAGRVSPNPMVGCVLVKGGRIVGEGFHKKFGGAHAEVEALDAAGEKARGATAYVTLEPCSHFGKTPPCVDALIEAGVTRVVAAMRDPNPLVNGKGLAKLKKAGFAIETGLLEQEAQELNRGFISRVARRRPYVILKAAVSLDGKMATSAGRSKWITGPAARTEGHKLRAAADAIMVGINTVVSDDPALTSHGKGKNPLRIILDSRGRMPFGAKVLDNAAPTLIFAARRSPRPAGEGERVPEGRVRVERLTVPNTNGHLNLKSILRILADRGIGTLLVEGGGELLTSFLTAGLADEIRLFIAPKLIGGKGANTFFGGKGIRSMTDALALEGMSVRKIGPDLMISGKIKH